MEVPPKGSDKSGQIQSVGELIDASASSGGGTSQTAASNHNQNTNIISGTVHTLINNNQIVTSIIYGEVSSDSDTVQVRITTILKSRHAPQAVYGAQIEKGCMDGTRVEVLRGIEAWLKSTNGPRVFWLTGMAGTGKSAIAWTVCARANNDPEIVLGGSFFCSRSTGLTSQRDIRCVVPTLAQLMARQSTAFSQALALELALDPDVLHQQVGVQVEKLLYRPLLALSNSPVPVLFVIDALDECGGQLGNNGAVNDAETHRVVSDMLEALVSCLESQSRLPVRFLVTSRPETQIRDTKLSDVSFSKVLQLHTVNKQDIAGDIHLFVSRKLLATPTLRALFTEGDVSNLVHSCDGLFLVAAVALEHTLGAGIDVATSRFKSLLNPTRDGLSAGATGPLDRTYTSILEEAAKSDEVHTERLKNMLRVLAALLSARMAVSVAALAVLVKLSSGQLRAVLSRLHAVIHVPDDDNDVGLRPLHASFGDYLFERASGRLRISASLGHELLADGCLHVMKEGLHFNVSQSWSSFEGNPRDKPSGVTLSLEYACLQWVYHVSPLLQTSTTDADVNKVFYSWLLPWAYPAAFTRHYRLDESINTIFRPRLLFWLEVMSVLGQVQRAAAMLVFAAATVREKILSRFLRDANSFVASSQDAISRSAPHIYISALPFADKDSLVYQDFAPLCSGLVTVDIVGIAHHAGRLVMTLTGHEGAVNSVSYSLDNRFLASGSADGTVRIWDMRTGEEAMKPLCSRDGAIHSVSFAPSSKDVASGTDHAVVCVWILAGFQASVQRSRGHSAAVSFVLYSPNGSRLASASLDTTVRLWDTETYHQIAVLRGHTDKAYALSFSPDGLMLATGSEDRTIQLWSVAASKPTQRSLYRDTRPIYSICFLPDGDKIAACCGEDVILCQPQTGKRTAMLYYGTGSIKSVSPSLDGRSVVSANGKSVCITTLPRLTADTYSAVLDGHADEVRSATFSSNGLYVASASNDRTIRIWTTSGKTEAKPAAVQKRPASSALLMSDSRQLTEHIDYFRSVTVSPDGGVIVSGNRDDSILVYDASTGVATLPPLLGHTGSVDSVVFSSDGRLILSGSGDTTVRLWDAKTGESVGQPMRLHVQHVRAVAFSPDTRWIASGSDDGIVLIWNVATQRLSEFGPLLCNGGVNAVVFSADGQVVAAADRSECVNLWRSETGQMVHEPLPIFLTHVFSIGLSPDAAHVVCGGPHKGGDSAHACVMNLITGQQAFTLAGHTDTVFSVAYLPGGRFIVTGSADQSIRLWDAITGAQIAVLIGHNGWVRSVTSTPDGRSIVSGAYDKTIRIWDISGAYEERLARGGDTKTALHFSTLCDGWLQAPTGELLLWVPAKYRQYLYTRRESPRAAILVEAGGWRRGKSWIFCWRMDESDPTSFTL